MSENSALPAYMVDFPLSPYSASTICIFKKDSDFPHSLKIRNGDSREKRIKKTLASTCRSSLVHGESIGQYI